MSDPGRPSSRHRSGPRRMSGCPGGSPARHARAGRRYRSRSATPLPTSSSCDSTGARRRLSEAWSGGPAVLVFMRHFGCSCLRERWESLEPALGAIQRGRRQRPSHRPGRAGADGGAGRPPRLPDPRLVRPGSSGLRGLRRAPGHARPGPPRLRLARRRRGARRGRRAVGPAWHGAGARGRPLAACRASSWSVETAASRSPIAPSSARTSRPRPSCSAPSRRPRTDAQPGGR